jgi:hypothetical protein
VNAHICQPAYRHLNGMREFYSVLQCYPTSTNGDIALIRSHIAYHSSSAAAERAVIKPSRGHTYRVHASARKGSYSLIVRITDPYDHRAGVHGWTS